MPPPPELSLLHTAAEAAARQFDCSQEGVFDPCGLILVLPPAKNYYEGFTPSNVVTFATTGGDGVHYSYLASPEFEGATCPIVMTLPCASTRNLVVAESLREFFCLGYHVGWFCLEQLVYKPEWAVSYFSGPDEELAEYAGDTLEYIRQALHIQPVPPSLERIKSLNERYGSYLVAPPET